MNEEIDWYSQWQAHAHGFHDGLAHICFSDLGLKQEGSMQLCPGPGFGDLSHPTTRLVLTQMWGHVAGKRVLDVGCGSGILSLAAARFGAKYVLGIDIDEAAIEHARANAELNGLQDICRFGKNQAASCDILLMNMIRSEQKEAYESLHPELKRAKIAYTSGILQEERKAYLALAASWGWKLADERELDGWLGFIFNM